MKKWTIDEVSIMKNTYKVEAETRDDALNKHYKYLSKHVKEEKGTTHIFIIEASSVYTTKQKGSESN